MKNNHILTFEELQALARKHYNHGGDAFVECWDEAMLKEHNELFSPMTHELAMHMMGFYEDVEKDEAGYGEE